MGVGEDSADWDLNGNRIEVGGKAAQFFTVQFWVSVKMNIVLGT